MELRARKVKNKPNSDQKNEENQKLCKLKQGVGGLWQDISLAIKDQHIKGGKRVKFDEEPQYCEYEVTGEYYRETMYNKFIKELWRKHNEAGKLLEHFSHLQQSQVPPKQQMVVLVTIFEKLRHQEKRIIDCLSESSIELSAEAHVTTENTRLQEEDDDDDENLQERPLNTVQTSQNNNGKNVDNSDFPVTIKAMTVAQEMILAATEKSSTPHITTELEIVRKEIDSIINEAIKNQHSLAAQLTSDTARSKELITLTRSKRITEERKWDKVIQRVGNQKAEEMKSYIKKIEEEAQSWQKKRQQKLNLAEKLMTTVNKERSTNCRIQMVTQNPELSQEIVLIEAARILSFIEVKHPQNNPHLDQWLDEQYGILTAKMTTKQANSVMQEVYNRLLIKRHQ